MQRKACVTYVALRTSYSEPFCVGNCVNYVAYVACARIDKSSILAYVRNETKGSTNQMAPFYDVLDC